MSDNVTNIRGEFTSAKTLLEAAIGESDGATHAIVFLWNDNTHTRFCMWKALPEHMAEAGTRLSYLAGYAFEHNPTTPA